MFTNIMYMTLLFGGQLFGLSVVGYAVIVTAGRVTGTTRELHKIVLWLKQTLIIASGLMILAASLWGIYEAGSWLIISYMF